MRLGRNVLSPLFLSTGKFLLLTSAFFSSQVAISGEILPQLVLKGALDEVPPTTRNCQVSVYSTQTIVTGRIPSPYEHTSTLDQFAANLVHGATWESNPARGVVPEGQAFGYQGNGRIASYLAVKMVGDGCGENLQLNSPPEAAIPLGKTTTASGANIRIFGLVSIYRTYNVLVSISTTLWFDWGSSILD